MKPTDDWPLTSGNILAFESALFLFAGIGQSEPAAHWLLPAHPLQELANNGMGVLVVDSALDSKEVSWAVASMLDSGHYVRQLVISAVGSGKGHVAMLGPF